MNDILEDSNGAKMRAGIGSMNVIDPSQPQTELDRCFMQLDKQRELISMLYDRLQPVVNPTPEEGTSNEVDRGHHISTVADLTRINNKKLQRLLEQLAI